MGGPHFADVGESAYASFGVPNRMSYGDLNSDGRIDVVVAIGMAPGTAQSAARLRDPSPHRRSEPLGPSRSAQSARFPWNRWRRP